MRRTDSVDRAEIGESLGFPAYSVVAYFALSDESDARSAWRGLAKAFGLDERQAAPFDQESHLSPLYVLGENGLVFFSVLRDSIAVGMMAGLADAKDVENYKGIMTSAFGQSLRSVLGFSSVIAADDESLEDAVGMISEKRRPLLSETAGLVPLALEGKHVYALRSRSSSAALSFLFEGLLPIDSILLKLKLTAPLYREEMLGVLEKRKSSDAAVASILNGKFADDAGDDEKIAALEQDVRRLAGLYSDLTGSLSLVRRSRDNLQKDLDHLSHRLGFYEDAVPLGQEAFHELLQDFHAVIARLNESLENIRAAIDVISTKVDLMRSREAAGLQKEAVSMQVAAGFIEFILLFYYTLHSWESLIGLERFEHFPAIFRFALTSVFSGLAVALTHEISKKIRGEGKSLLAAVVLFVGAGLVVLLMALLP